MVIFNLNGSASFISFGFDMLKDKEYEDAMPNIINREIEKIFLTIFIS
jgi:hypothetical protein